MEQLIKPKLYVNPMIDVAFKYLFGTEKNKHLLKGLLENVFKKEIAEIIYDNTEQIGESVDARNAYFDVVCRSPNGEEFIVECQVRPQDYFAERALFYVSRVVSSQAPKGPWDYGFRPVYFLGLIDFALPESIGRGPGYVQRYSIMNDANGEHLTDALQFVFMEVGPFDKTYGECESFEEKFLFYMKNLPIFVDRPDTHQEEYFDELLQTAEFLAMDMETQAMYEKRLKEMRDIQNVENYFRRVTLAEGFEKGREEGLVKGREEGLAEGRAEGLAKGREEGREEGLAKAKSDVALGMLRHGIAPEIVSDITGLSEADILKLVSEQK